MNASTPPQIYYRTNNKTPHDVVNDFPMNKTSTLSEESFLPLLQPNDIVKYYVTNESYALPLLMEAAYVRGRKSGSVSMILNLLKDPSAGLDQMQRNTPEISNLTFRSSESYNKLNTLKNDLKTLVDDRTRSDELITDSADLFVKLSNLLVKASLFLGAHKIKEFGDTVTQLNEAKASYSAYFSKNDLVKLSNQTDETLINQVVLSNERDELKKGYIELATLAKNTESSMITGSPLENSKRSEIEKLRQEKMIHNNKVSELKKKVKDYETKTVPETNNTFKERIEKIQQNKSNLDAKLLNNKRRYEQLYSEYETLKKELESSKIKSNQYAQELANIEQEKATITSIEKGNLQLAKTELQTLEQAWNTKKNQNIRRLETELENQQKMLTSLKNIIPLLESTSLKNSF